MPCRSTNGSAAIARLSRALVDDELDDIKPVGLGGPLVSFDRIAGWIDDVAANVSELQRATDHRRAAIARA